MPVVVVGSCAQSARSCATGTLSYVSLRPPLVAASLSQFSRTYQLAHESGYFSVSFLRDDQVDVAVSAAKRGVTTDKFVELGLGVLEWNGVPALADCGAVVWCSIEQEHPVGDSVLCVGQIRWSTPGSSDGAPLLRFGGRYHALGRGIDAANESPYPL